jgi:lantibiotic modifying enzyme
MNLQTQESSARQFLAAAQDLGERVWERHVQSPDGQVTWLRPGSEPRGEPVDLQKRVDPFLYDGTAGIALFLAALGRATGDPVWRERGLQAISPVRLKMREIAADPARAARLDRLGIGGMIGLGSLIYTFLRIGELAAEPQLAVEAHSLPALITPERIAADSSCDVLYGGAGAILALLALHRSAAGGDGAPLLETTAACARHLLSRQQSFSGSPGTWQSLPGLPPLGGFSHGAAGICHALLRLWQETGEPRLLAGAQEGLAFERTLYSAEHKGWRDPKSTEPRYAAGWCLGAAGQALARLPALKAFGTSEIREEIAHGLATARSAPLEPVDHLCCGNLGRAEVLLRASEALGDAELRTAAEELARATLARAEQAGAWRWRFDPRPGLFDPTFFTGAAGVGYTLLRLASPRRLPCMLALD